MCDSVLVTVTDNPLGRRLDHDVSRALMHRQKASERRLGTPPQPLPPLLQFPSGKVVFNLLLAHFPRS